MSGMSHAPRATSPSQASPVEAAPSPAAAGGSAGNAAALEAMAQQTSGAGASPPAAPGSPTAPSAATRGSAMVFAEAEGTEYGFTSHGLPDLANLLLKDPNADLDDVLELVGDKEFHVDYRDEANFPQTELHPTLAAYGDRDTPVRNKTAVLVANANYAAPNHPLPAVTGQASALQAQLASRGFGGPGVVNDQPAPGIAAAFSGAVNGAQAGDEVVAAFTGHGSEQGLIGITSAAGDVYTNAQVSALVSAATAKDVHIRVILDACHSGQAAAYVREERMNELEDDARVGLVDRELLNMARQATDLHYQLVDHVNARRQALGSLLADINVVNGKAPSITDFSAMMKWMSLLGAMWDKYHQMEREYDDKVRDVWSAALGHYQNAVCVVGILCDVHLVPPRQIDDFARLGEQLDFLDAFANAAMHPAEDDVDPD